MQNNPITRYQIDVVTQELVAIQQEIKRFTETDDPQISAENKRRAIKALSKKEDSKIWWLATAKGLTTPSKN